ncbi:MAG: energy transducer TonB, partial [Alphaproteobacteria bacterium]|nr:energy transducer TonB [Alphaproteobacteria bacterium]
MRKGLTLSIALHVAVVALAWFGLPNLRKDPDIMEEPIVVDVVTLSQMSNPAPPAPQPTPSPAVKPVPPQVAQATPPTPPPPPAP